MAFRSNKESRTRQILDYLDQLKNNHSDILDRSTSSLNSSNTQRWLHDIGLRKLPPTPSRSIRTPSRLSSIIAASKFKSSFHQRPASHLSPTSSKKVLEKSIEIQPEPEEEVEVSHVRSTPYLAATEKSHKSIVKSVSGQNVARTNTFSARIPELSVDRNGIDPIPQEELQAVKPLQTDVEPGFLMKNRAFTFSKPVVRGPEAVEEEEEMEQTLDEPSSPSTDSGASSEGETVDDEVVEERTKDDSGATSSLKAATNTETSSSDTSPNKSVDVPVVAAVAKKWECPTCMLQVDADKTTCPCCMTNKDGTTASKETLGSTLKPSTLPASTLPPPDSKFKFGLPSSVSNVTPSVSNSTTSTNSNLTSTPAPFKFGFSNTNGTKEATPSIPAFGSNSSAPVATTTTNANGLTDNKPAIPAFGLPISSSSTTGSFNFSSTTAPAPFKFGTANTNGTMETTSSASLFGSTTTNPVTTSAIGATDSNGVMENKSLPAFGFPPTSSAAPSTFNFAGTSGPPKFQFGAANTKETAPSVPTFNFGSGSSSTPSFNFTSGPAPATFQFGAANPNGTKESTPSIPTFGSTPAAPTTFNFTGTPAPPTFQFGAANTNGTPAGVMGSTPFPSNPDTNPFMPTSSSTGGRKFLSARRKLRQH